MWREMTGNASYFRQAGLDISGLVRRLWFNASLRQVPQRQDLRHAAGGTRPFHHPADLSRQSRSFCGVEELSDLGRLAV